MQEEKRKVLRVALAGNPNCGKTTLFNRLTGSSQYVGNWPGVTVEKKGGRAFYEDWEIEITDLPGVYSLSPYSPEEAIADRFLREEKPDVVIDVVDATNPERNLYLTMQLLECGMPAVVALNMLDVLEKRGDRVDCKRFQEELGVPVIPISAAKGNGIPDLLRAVVQIGTGRRPTVCRLPYKAPEPDMPDREAVWAERRYNAVEAIVARCMVRMPQPEKSLSDRIDAVVTNRFFAIPLFFAMVFFIFVITFGSIGSFLADGVAAFFTACSLWAEQALLAAGASVWARSLVVDGMLAGVGSVVSFLPQIILLFFLLSLLEDSGYMARAAFIMDAPMRKLGLSGRAFVPLLMGFGCTVPAVMGTRILENEKDKRLTILILPFMSCSAKMPVYSLFIAAFFPDKRPLAIFCFYLLGIVLGILSALFFKNTVLKGDSAPFVMELPPYRLPTFKSLRLHVWERIKDFLQRAGTVLLGATVLIWLLRSFSPGFQYVTDSSQSMLAQIGGWIAPMFTLCGFGEWKPAVSLLTGLIAKESVVSSMGVLYGGAESLTTALQGAFTPLSTCSFLLFVLFYTPCVAALSAIRREMASLKWTAITVIWQLGVAWYASALFYQVASLLQKCI